MKRSWKRTPLKRKNPLKAYKGLSVRTALKALSQSDTAQTKRRIQSLLREIVMKRDKGCILAEKRCGRQKGDPGVVWQADHLITRSNSATYGDFRLVVLVCKNCHGWKSVGNNLRKREYDELVRSVLPPDRVALWDRAELEAGKHKAVKIDWNLVELSLKAELKRYVEP